MRVPNDTDARFGRYASGKWPSASVEVIRKVAGVIRKVAGVIRKVAGVMRKVAEVMRKNIGVMKPVF
ncbi:MAG TPA: hypothetical protein DCL18_01795 [Prevotella sp.]|nr:hypothetical protein [Prevotella sp.]